MPSKNSAQARRDDDPKLTFLALFGAHEALGRPPTFHARHLAALGRPHTSRVSPAKVLRNWRDVRSRRSTGQLCLGLPNVGDRLTDQTCARRRRLRCGDALDTWLCGSGENAVRRSRVRTAAACTLRHAAVTCCSRARTARRSCCRCYTSRNQKRLWARCQVRRRTLGSTARPHATAHSRPWHPLAPQRLRPQLAPAGAQVWQAPRRAAPAPAALFYPRSYVVLPHALRLQRCSLVRGATARYFLVALHHMYPGESAACVPRRAGYAVGPQHSGRSRLSASAGPPLCRPRFPLLGSSWTPRSVAVTFGGSARSPPARSAIYLCFWRGCLCLRGFRC